MAVACTITSTDGTLGPTAELQVHVPATITVTGLTASTAYLVLISTPNGGSTNFGPNEYVSNGSGVITITNYTPAAVGAGAVNVFNSVPTATFGPTTATVVNQL